MGVRPTNVRRRCVACAYTDGVLFRTHARWAPSARRDASTRPRARARMRASRDGRRLALVLALAALGAACARLARAPARVSVEVERAIATYAARADARTRTSACDAAPMVGEAWACARRGRGARTYPRDAEKHFGELRRALAPWSQHAAHESHSYANATGPWIENKWIEDFEGAYDASTGCLYEFFGPFVPLFVPWTDVWLQNNRRYPRALRRTLRRMLRPDVVYVTVSQNDQGLLGSDRATGGMAFPNVLVFSAGGYGHVPIPLLKSSLEPLRNEKSMDERGIDISFVGSLHTAPNDLRVRAHEALSRMNDAGTLKYSYYKGTEWRNIMADTRVSLAPRGFGRSSFHLYEILQMGLIPLYVYSDEPWLPFVKKNSMIKDLIIACSESEFERTIEKIQKLSARDLTEMESKIASLRESHFSMDGVLDHIRRFLLNQPNDLSCQALPRTVRDSKRPLFGG